MTLAQASRLQSRLRHIYGLGGSGAGKSIVARRIAEDRAMAVYSTDDVMSDHAKRLSDADAPLLARFKSMDMDERWVNRSPGTMLESFHWFRGEGLNLIVEDLLALSETQRVIVEGLRLLPRLLRPLLFDQNHAAWILPTPEFRVRAFEGRGTTWLIAEKTSNPELALHNLLERDRMFTEQLREETKRLGLNAIVVDTPVTEDELVQQVSRAFEI